jgi:hypothetical protein
VQMKMPPGDTIIPASSTRLRCASLFSIPAMIRAEHKEQLNVTAENRKICARKYKVFQLRRTSYQLAARRLADRIGFDQSCPTLLLIAYERHQRGAKILFQRNRACHRFSEPRASMLLGLRSNSLSTWRAATYAKALRLSCDSSSVRCCAN